MPRRRGLSAEDRALWEQVAAGTAPLRPEQRRPVVEPQPAAPVFMAAKAPLPRFRVGEVAPKRVGATVDRAPLLADRLRAAPVQMDGKTHKRMTRGKIAPDARIDLHGMTLAVAQPVLTGFVLDAHAAGRRLLLVITGKGKPRGPDAPLPVRPGALRHFVPHWLHAGALARVVLQVTPAHLRHGGDGAYYVYLRK